MNIKYDIIDTTLKLVDKEDIDIRTEVENLQLEQILKSNYSVQLNNSKREQMIANLQDKYSFGQLVNVKISEYQTTANELAKEIRLSKPQLVQLLEDKVYANNIPVKKLKRLLTTLNISFEKAEKAIRKSFEILISNQTERRWKANTQLSFRRNATNNSTRNSYSNHKSGIYENEQSLEKYLEHLKELI